MNKNGFNIAFGIFIQHVKTLDNNGTTSKTTNKNLLDCRFEWKVMATTGKLAWAFKYECVCIFIDGSLISNQMFVRCFSFKIFSFSVSSYRRSDLICSVDGLKAYLQRNKKSISIIVWSSLFRHRRCFAFRAPPLNIVYYFNWIQLYIIRSIYVCVASVCVIGFHSARTLGIYTLFSLVDQYNLIEVTFVTNPSKISIKMRTKMHLCNWKTKSTRILFVKSSNGYNFSWTVTINKSTLGKGVK